MSPAGDGSRVRTLLRRAVLHKVASGAVVLAVAGVTTVALAGLQPKGPTSPRRTLVSSPSPSPAASPTPTPAPSTAAVPACQPSQLEITDQRYGSANMTGTLANDLYWFRNVGTTACILGGAPIISYDGSSSGGGAPTMLVERARHSGRGASLYRIFGHGAAYPAGAVTLAPGGFAGFLTIGTVENINATTGGPIPCHGQPDTVQYLTLSIPSVTLRLTGLDPAADPVPSCGFNVTPLSPIYPIADFWAPPPAPPTESQISAFWAHHWAMWPAQFTVVPSTAAGVAETHSAPQATP
jgi:hypothetical protein